MRLHGGSMPWTAPAAPPVARPAPLAAAWSSWAEGEEMTVMGVQGMTAEKKSRKSPVWRPSSCWPQPRQAQYNSYRWQLDTLRNQERGDWIDQQDMQRRVERQQQEQQQFEKLQRQQQQFENEMRQRQDESETNAIMRQRLNEADQTQFEARQSQFENEMQMREFYSKLRLQGEENEKRQKKRRSSSDEEFLRKVFRRAPDEFRPLRRRGNDGGQR